MILLDTNVVSELMRPKPDPNVEDWLANQSTANVFLSVITEAELRYGVAILPAGQRRDRIAAAVENMLQKDFARRILPFDSEAARIYAEIGARPTGRWATDQPRRLSGSGHRPLSRSGHRYQKCRAFRALWY